MGEDSPDQASQRHPVRALVALRDERVPAPDGLTRPLATFLTQLLACQIRMAQFRRRRRMQPRSAAELYRVRAAPPASRLDRSL